jgi:aquaporin Z
MRAPLVLSDFALQHCPQINRQMPARSFAPIRDVEAEAVGRLKPRSPAILRVRMIGKHKPRRRLPIDQPTQQRSNCLRLTATSRRRKRRKAMSIAHRLGAEFLGTFWLVLGGCGSAVLAAKFPGVGIGFMGVALAFGLTVLTMVYALGPISGGHFNPAVTVGLAAGGRFAYKDVIPYIIAQVIGAIVAAAVLKIIASGAPQFDLVASGFAANGFDTHSPGGYSFNAALTCEIVMTFGFLIVILGATDVRAAPGFAGLAIGLALTLIHLVSIPVTNTSVNPARSTGPALFVGGWALEQLWLFWVAPIIGAVIAGIVFRWFQKPDAART